MFIPGLKQNLISIGQLIRKGYYVIFNDEKYLICEKKNLKTSSNREDDKK